MENVKQDASIGTNILRVSASDEDADNNGAIIYTLSAPYNPADIEYFEIQPESGWIVLKKPLDVSIITFTIHLTLVRVFDKIDEWKGSTLLQSLVDECYLQALGFNWHLL